MTKPGYPVTLRLEGRRCLVVGGGVVAARKIASLLECGAAVTVVAPSVHVALGILSSQGAIDAIEDSPLDVQIRPYRAGEAASYRLVVAATGDREVNTAVRHDAEAAGVWVNSADDPANCTFTLPAVYR
ncbi:MAG: precorrin-2 dehydrogenase/sirohydrochlorin ferrochelatase family protein, partial [Acidimicrobiales bacterium]